MDIILKLLTKESDAEKYISLCVIFLISNTLQVFYFIGLAIFGMCILCS